MAPSAQLGQLNSISPRGLGLATYEDFAGRTHPQSQVRTPLILFLVPFVRVGHNVL